jgi:carbonic anhydrase
MSTSKPASPVTISADEALQRLIDGNNRFRSGQVTYTGLHLEALKALAEGQSPFATIVGCSDSRVPVELVFDAGLGDLFVIRVAGNVFSPEVAGSLQYAGAILHTPLFIVMGHEGCGAVKAALNSREKVDIIYPRIQLLVDRIVPGLPKYDPQLSSTELLAQAVESNVRWTVQQILDTPEGRARVAEGRMKIVGAIYEIASGRVNFLP